ncbi:MAG: DUF349 domain-containing protein [Cytophagaceae bacterium]|nr:DUF349 domain-containing protein [Cytophagaceae bacterium]
MENPTAQHPFGYVRDGKVFLKGYLEYPDRQIGEVRNTEAEAIQYFINRFQLADTKVAQLELQVEEAQNKGSYLTKLMQLRKTLLEFDGLGDFIPLLEQLDTLEVRLRELIKVNQAKNLEIKHALIEEARQIVQIEDWNEATEQMQDLKTKWLKTGPVEKPYEDETEGELQRIADDFFQRRREFFTEKNRLIDERLATLQRLVDSAFRLRRMEDLDAAFQEIKLLQAEWKTIGQVPPKKQSMLWKQFKKANDLFFEKYNNTKGIVPKPRVNPILVLLEGMVGEAEGLLKNQQDFNKAADRAKQLLVNWKETSAKMKSSVDRQLSERFRAACDKIFEMNYLVRVIGYRHPFFNEKPRVEQLKIMINQMDYLVRKEKTDLMQFEDSSNASARNTEADRTMVSKINTQRRKVAMKEILLIEFKRELDVLLA